MIAHVLKKRYKILQEIGTGGMAKIYLAQDLQQERSVAVKVLHPQFSEDPAFLQRFKREAMLAKTLNEPHIVPVLDEGAEDGRHFLVMEYMEGPNLHRLIQKKGPFEWPAALKIIYQLAVALEHAHGHGVIHRDIKPQNLIITQPGLLKVLDFGIARVTTLPSLTQTGAIMGSPQYVSPEQVRGRDISYASDIYSAGLVLYEMLTGTSLFEGETPWSIISYYVSYKPLPLQLPEAQIPESVLTLLEQMLARDPENRPQATLLRQKIEEILADHDLVKLEPKSRATSQMVQVFTGQPWRKRLEQAGVALGLIVIALLTGLLIFGTNTRAFEEESKAQLKSLYEEAHLEIEKGNRGEAILKLDQILQADPGYADAALIRDELLAQFVPTSLSPSEVRGAPTPTVELLSQLLEQAQQDIHQGRWTEAIVGLEAIKLPGISERQQARLAALLCDAYLERGLDRLAEAALRQDELPVIRQALADFEAGVSTCPRRTDLRDQAEQASAYLKALLTSPGDYEISIRTLRPLVANAPDYMNQRAKEALYYAYLQRAGARQLAAEPVAAVLADYEAALALQVDNPSVALARRARLLHTLVQSARIAMAEDKDPASPAAGSASNFKAMKYRQPFLTGPINDMIFAGRFAEVYLEWQAVGELAASEYYDVTIMHLFAGEPRYLGSTRTRETRVKIGPEIGVGEAANDRFYWWITVRKADTAPTPDSLDLPLSPQSEARTFIWGS